MVCFLFQNQPRFVSWVEITTFQNTNYAVLVSNKIELETSHSYSRHLKIQKASYRHLGNAPASPALAVKRLTVTIAILLGKIQVLLNSQRS